MTPENPQRVQFFETRLDGLREEARQTGRVEGTTASITGGPMPRGTDNRLGYYGQPVIKQPVWTWEVGLYFFIGGVAGMSGLIALAAFLTGYSINFVGAALALAASGAVISPMLLIADLGRPRRFLNMLRVFKWRSPMSMGVWILVLFSSCAVPGFLMAEVIGYTAEGFQGTLLLALILGAACFGLLLATYTGVLLGATAIPVWSAHHKLLPVHFGIVALGSATAALELLGFRIGTLDAFGLAVAAIETGVGAWIELGRRGAVARSLHTGTSGLLLRMAGLAMGPIALIARLSGWIPVAGSCFLIGALLSRYGWIAAGRISACDPEEVFEEQRLPQ